MNRVLIAIGVLASITVATTVGVRSQTANVEGPQFSSKGELLRPTDYKGWKQVTVRGGMRFSSDTTELDPGADLYVHPQAYDAFNRTGEWPENTILMIELRPPANSKSSLPVYDGLLALEAAVKDRSRFPETTWGYFQFDLPTNATTAPAAPYILGCYSCHATLGAVDNTFVQFYPELLEIARRMGKMKPASSH